MHSMQPIAVHDPDICQTVTWVGCANTAERINVLFSVETPRDPRNIVLDRGPCPPR